MNKTNKIEFAVFFISLFIVQALFLGFEWPKSTKEANIEKASLYVAQECAVNGEFFVKKRIGYKVTRIKYRCEFVRDRMKVDYSFSSATL